MYFYPSKWNWRKFKYLIQIFTSLNWRGKKNCLYTFQELARFIVQCAREHYLLPCKKWSAVSLIGKKWEQKQNWYLNHLIFWVYFSYFQYFCVFLIRFNHKYWFTCVLFDLYFSKCPNFSEIFLSWQHIKVFVEKEIKRLN